MGPQVHRLLTREWAVLAGLEEIADEVAEANDDLDRLYPGRHLVYSPLHLGPSAALFARWALRRAIRRRSPRFLGWALHGVQDFHGHGALGQWHFLWMLGLRKTNPDVWETASERVRTAIRESSLRYLRAYRDAVGG